MKEKISTLDIEYKLARAPLASELSRLENDIAIEIAAEKTAELENVEKQVEEHQKHLEASRKRARELRSYLQGNIVRSITRVARFCFP